MNSNENIKFQSTCFYSVFKSDAVAEAKKYREMGFKAHTTMSPGNKYNRGYKGPYYGVAVEEAYYNDQEIERLRKAIENTESIRMEALKRFEAEIAQINADNVKRVERLNELIAKKAGK